MSIAPVEIGNDRTAFSVLTQALTGKMTFIDADFCTTCGERGAEKRSSLCNMVTYCGLICQRLHWPTHKICRGLQEKDTLRLREHCDEESDMVKETASFLAELCF
ncbi:ankyrin repeat and MYND domain-containing protein 2 [Oncorhynchus tshawytscha]|uniref:ankyrin repeat and MYND domain-containing protein 2 n=1 Tax=Oncorhynchus tshawytscha TaxID=74940 RepID=UPI001C3D33FE|nr:ankyrin repeat and MYND domain-containing protein 2 [Oncorhynchus tshawytscha]